MHLEQQEGAHAIQNKTSALVKGKTLAAIEKVLNEFDLPGKTIRIPKLEIDLTHQAIDDIDELFILKIEEQLRDELAKLLHQENIYQTALQSGVGAQKSGIEIVTAFQNQVQAIVFFLENGYLPWWTPTEFRSIEPLIKQCLEETQQQVFFFKSIAPVLQNENVRKRLVNLLPVQALEKILYQFDFPLPLQPWKKQLLNATYEHQPVYAHALLACAVPDMPVKKWLTYFFEQQPRLKKIQQLISIAGVEETQLLTECIVETTNFKADEKIMLLESIAQKTPNVSAIQELIKKIKQAPEQKNNPVKKENPQTEIEGIYINYAGLVILHAYLPHFFKALHLLDGKLFVDQNAQHLAVHLLHYAATGDTTLPEEHELVLTKLLCGLEPEDALITGFELTQEQKQECENVMESVLEHWKALKRSSVAALRHGFMLRNGKLKRSHSGWSLYIERSALDILVDKLPWSISMIKLPWYNELIYVEW